MTASLLSLWPQSLSLTNPRVTGFSDKSVSGDCEHESPCLACEHQVGRIVHLPYHAGARACLWNLQACLIVATVILSQKQGLLMEARRLAPGSPENPRYHLAKVLLWLRAFEWATAPLIEGVSKVHTGPPAWLIASILLFSLENLFKTAPSTGLLVALEFSVS